MSTSERDNFGIVGGYGATGQAVVAELSKSGNRRILIGGRDLTKGKALAAEFGSQVTAAHLDVLDARSLDNFCSQCSIVVNCAGPVKALQDRVAQAAFRQHCHYVDPAGMSIVAERMRDKSREIADLGLCFVVSAGWMPGVIEVASAYAHAQATAQMDTIDSVAVYSGDSGEWSVNALRDGVWYIRKVGLKNPGYFRKGTWVRATRSEAFPMVTLGDPLGTRRFGMFFSPELNEIGRQLKDCDVLAYSYLSGFRTILSSILIAALPLPESVGVRLLRNVFRRNHRLSVGGFVAARVLGRSQGRQRILTVQTTYPAHHDYWIHGLAMATVAGMVAEGQTQRGVHFLADAVDSKAFMTRLQAAGVEQTESVDL